MNFLLEIPPRIVLPHARGSGCAQSIAHRSELLIVDYHKGGLITEGAAQLAGGQMIEVSLCLVLRINVTVHFCYRFTLRLATH
jgi:hypothetical protein